MDHTSIPGAQSAIGSFSSKGGEWIVIQTKPELGYERWRLNLQVSIKLLSSRTEAHLQVSWLYNIRLPFFPLSIGTINPTSVF